MRNLKGFIVNYALFFQLLFSFVIGSNGLSLLEFDTSTQTVDLGLTSNCVSIPVMYYDTNGNVVNRYLNISNFNVVTNNLNFIDTFSSYNIKDLYNTYLYPVRYDNYYQNFFPVYIKIDGNVYKLDRVYQGTITTNSATYTTAMDLNNFDLFYDFLMERCGPLSDCGDRYVIYNFTQGGGKTYALKDITSNSGDMTIYFLGNDNPFSDYPYYYKYNLWITYRLANDVSVDYLDKFTQVYVMDAVESVDGSPNCSTFGYLVDFTKTKEENILALKGVFGDKAELYVNSVFLKLGELAKGYFVYEKTYQSINEEIVRNVGTNVDGTIINPDTLTPRDDITSYDYESSFLDGIVDSISDTFDSFTDTVKDSVKDAFGGVFDLDNPADNSSFSTDIEIPTYDKEKDGKLEFKFIDYVKQLPIFNVFSDLKQSIVVESSEANVCIPHTLDYFTDGSLTYSLEFVNVSDGQMCLDLQEMFSYSFVDTIINILMFSVGVYSFFIIFRGG
jgi:hypothetical protein